MNDPEYADIDESGQFSLGVAGEQRALPGLADAGKPAPLTFERDAIEQAARQDVEPAHGRTRARRERRAARRREWAEGREEKAERALQTSQDATAGIPFGQPILAGHHSQRRHERAIERGQKATRRFLEHADMAKKHEHAADAIEAELRASIYSDDDDAIERLEERIAGLEAERERWKAYNAACRKAKRRTTEALAHLDEGQRRSIETTARVQAYALGKHGEAPRYVLANLGANINRQRKRLQQLRSRLAADA